MTTEPKKPPKDARLIELIDGRVYWSTDNFFTAYNANGRKVGGKMLQTLRLLAAFRASS